MSLGLVGGRGFLTFPSSGMSCQSSSNRDIEDTPKPSTPKPSRRHNLL
jgi:hypothetical protein